MGLILFRNQLHPYRRLHLFWTHPHQHLDHRTHLATFCLSFASSSSFSPIDPYLYSSSFSFFASQSTLPLTRINCRHARYLHLWIITMKQALAHHPFFNVWLLASTFLVFDSLRCDVSSHLFLLVLVFIFLIIFSIIRLLFEPVQLRVPPAFFFFTSFAFQYQTRRHLIQVRPWAFDCLLLFWSLIIFLPLLPLVSSPSQ